MWSDIYRRNRCDLHPRTRASEGVQNDIGALGKYLNELASGRESCVLLAKHPLAQSLPCPSSCRWQRIRRPVALRGCLRDYSVRTAVDAVCVRIDQRSVDGVSTVTLGGKNVV